MPIIRTNIIYDLINFGRTASFEPDMPGEVWAVMYIIASYHSVLFASLPDPTVNSAPRGQSAKTNLFCEKAING
jgi:hypothetical protein